ncbi:hypothetical protein A2331_03350 [Candidatus Falkowbacteria bacterium RIFOXYB2_FULL_34_18]|uniref:Amine oxidase domain-containing protein n=1 Tax=Candidatus Falkowbacteria bacterium RIFOXYD2_FULL_34_120 TaxID=1798007 RepID=A0A1F5TPT1_9BACT|nr:MAG: hypothetical protein A2331_03350 [Candidatus Falkowbacteria bacterium RIFOXYB2_FULL_34_18]OGF28943.1 MAG: hypothetical protein A2500_01710 [Candidatus Falkowbacteria bacterium RIFOXYC12_FULL_34_55]OGF35858.1 MAG: hypothetical protein A2466_03670 [Candidatus Falkowbacteria bacterium RIFOXYC2_FULL_34_220]OGF38465.1 MAG: hypothetical protein A2515_07040 [Candidatus Falkowbacteria bacterium RIFOXYD12_FULL_34_57]OGF40531.1 MAG: hypothetical protein A2531_04455 [Candidatus Falkowbacteria bact
MKVGIIGGGVAGLTCGYQLQKNNIKTIIWEKEPYVGGRNLYNIGAVSKGRLYKNSHKLIEELGLESLYTPLPSNNFGLICWRFMLKAEKTKSTMRFAPKKIRQFYADLMEKLEKMDFDLENPSAEIKELRNISFAEYIADFPKMIKLLVVDPELNFAFEPNYEKIAADYGLHLLKHGVQVVSGQDYVFEENLLPLTNILEEKIKMANNIIHTSAEILKVEQTENNHFIVNYKINGEEKSEIVDKIVFATPLHATQKIFPSLKIESDINYNPIRCVFTRGKLKYDRKIMVSVREKDISNISMFATTMSHEHIIVAFDLEKEIRFKTLYKKNEYEVISEKIIDRAWPVRPPKARVPELKTNVPGAYLCGDFYYYTLIETSIATANMVSKMIQDEI